MEGSVQKTAWAIGAQLLVFAVGLAVIFLIFWAASKAWKRGQQDSNYLADGGDWLYQPRVKGTIPMKSSGNVHYGKKAGEQGYFYGADVPDWISQKVTA